jgi:hypothetical protein
MHDWISPRLGIRFDMSGMELVVWHRDGTMFLTDEEQVEQYEDERAARKEAQRKQKEAQHEADQERRKRENLERQLELAREKLRELGAE